MESAVPVSPQCTAMKESFLFLMPSAQNWYLEQVRLTSRVADVQEVYPAIMDVAR